MISIIFILESKYKMIDLNNASYSDAMKISPYRVEREIIFFPFSFFEIRHIEKIDVDNSHFKYNIYLKYLGSNYFN